MEVDDLESRIKSDAAISVHGGDIEAGNGGINNNIADDDDNS